MPVTYAVSYSHSPQGPWSDAAAVAGPSYAITGLLPGTYYVLIAAEDSAIGLLSPPTIVGPFAIAEVTHSFSSGFSSGYSTAPQQ